MKKTSKSLLSRIQKIKLVLFDVDGVMTDGTILVHPDGSESKSFDVRDGIAVRLGTRAGLKFGFLSGRMSPAVAERAKELGMEVCVQGATEKKQEFMKVLESLHLTPDAVAYMGDDIVDVPVLRIAGFAATVADGCEDAKRAAHYVCKASGGRGAARELVELILKSQKRWNDVAGHYLSG
ncbi:MAG: HAD-IIIA family hydrolase [Acidobacteriia bacterium]|nr:HAD-IIIA family hydrolase [Terriglobia bacterium]